MVEQTRRSKTSAALLALFMGWAGIHRFYLGQIGLGILYCFLMLVSFGFLPALLGLIDAIVLFSMDDQTFDQKYNTPKGSLVPPAYRTGGYPTPNQRQRGRRMSNKATMQMPPRELANPYKLSGIKKHKEFDLEGAIEDFKKGLEIEPQDISLHFNLACAYSLTEQVDKAYAHLDRAVALGFTDFEKIKSHDDLAYVRIQDRWEAFKKNGFRLELPATTDSTPPDIPEKEPQVQDDMLLSQLKRLAELRERGLLSEQEFIIEKKKLTR